jgi:predicted ATPase/class 3 adenylate cyclase
VARGESGAYEGRRTGISGERFLSATSRERSEALPTGTVTFAFTDIEGSTARWERDRAAMQDAVRRHDTIMRAAIAAHDGVVFKTIGDAFCAAFARPEDAVAAMLDAQRALAAEDFSAVDGLRVRAAIHTGTADERDGDYFGPAVNRVARLLAIGHGGQVLVSGVTADLVQGELPSQASLRDLGEHRLRDLARPEYVYQLVAPNLSAEFPALRSLDVLPNNLPLALTSFVGREKEIAEITDLIAQHRLVTLVGSGGVGKTRTSLQVAANLLDGSGDGVWFIELAPLASGDYIPSTIAQAIGIALPPEGDPVENLAHMLKRKRALLVFDNCEHLVEPAARMITTLLRGCPQVKLLASSRQGLGIAGEATYRMPSLGFPREGDGPPMTAAGSTKFTAISLFVERARAVDNRFGLTDENAPSIADVCRRLDGIPLAIELAASRVKMFSPQQIRDRLDERFRMLTGGSRDALPRQQTLRALIDWSHDLLDDRERALFRRLGIFVNGFTYEGAVAVGAGEDLDEFELFDLLGSLVDKSLVLAEPQGNAVRYRLLESTRAYASEKLDVAGERELAEARHLRYLRDRFAELWTKKERTARTAEFVEALTAELEDLRYALDAALARSAVAEGAKLLSFIEACWRDLGLDPEGIRRNEQYILALPRSESQLLARLSIALASLLGEYGQRTSASRVAMDAVAYARESGDAEALGYALRGFAVEATRLRRFDDAETALAEAEALPSASRSFRQRLLDSRALLSFFTGNFEAAVQALEQLAKEHRALGNVRGEGVARLGLAEVEHARDRTPRAIEIVHEILPALRAGKDKVTLGNTLANLAAYFTAVDDLSDAVSAARECISIYATSEPDYFFIAIAIEHLALAYALGGDLARAARLEGYSDTILDREGYGREISEMKTYDRLMPILRTGLSPDGLARLLADGAALTPEAAIALALEESDP